MPRRKKIVVEVRRGNDGKLYSQIRDELVREYDEPTPIVIDRQRGRQYDQDTVLTRAKGLAKLLEVPLRDYPEIPCIANRGFVQCMCPKCVNQRASKRA
jgi:hypothetical protein